ncbi:MAG: hypothetical protein K8953_07460 [Proteobacteria bacterium]|nr:hypothetical protein [Pseudomonadota bacterium]
MLKLKTIIYATMCIFTLAACQSTSTPPSGGTTYPVESSYETTFLKNHSRNSHAGGGSGAIVLAVITIVLLIVTVGNIQSGNNYEKCGRSSC